MTDSLFRADTDAYREASVRNIAPPPITSDPLVDGATPIEQLLGVLGLAANAGDLTEDTEAIEEHARRDAQAIAAAEAFDAQDGQAAMALAGQLPQFAAGLAGALTAPLGQATGGIWQAAQAGFGLAGSSATLDPGELGVDLSEDLGGEFGDGPDGDLEEALIGPAFGGGGVPAGLPPVAGAGPPAQRLGAPPVPSAPTAPASVPGPPAAPPTAALPAPPPAAGMAGLPWLPPGAVTGAGGNGGENRQDPKRVSVPPVRNGAPVQGRLPVPAGPAKPVEGKPVAVRRVVAPG